MDSVRHERDSGRRLHEESIRLQQWLAEVPLPVEEAKGHPVLRATCALVATLVLIALALLLLPPGG